MLTIAEGDRAVPKLARKKTRPGGWGKTSQTLTVTGSVTARIRLSARCHFVESKVRMFGGFRGMCRVAAKRRCARLKGVGSSK